VIAGAWLLVLAAVPRISPAPGLEPAFELQRTAVEAWESLDVTWQAVRQRPPPAPRVAIVIERSRLAPGTAGLSELGRVFLRQAREGVLSPSERQALAHELAHQFLLQACPVASGDSLFHEAFAVATSGELTAWREGDYQSLSDAAKVLGLAKSLDTPVARRALARLLVESLGPGDRLPRVVARKLDGCDGATRWVPLTVEALTSLDAPAGSDAWVVLSRHSGEVLLSSGDIAQPRPFGSTLKPFLIAGADVTPGLPPRIGDQEWACGDVLPATLRAPEATLSSCNGWFLDWADQQPGAERFGPWGPVLQSVGLSRLPEHMSEAIGLRSTLSLSPLGLAAAYRLLAEARPDVIKLLQRNVTEGTLSNLADSARLAGVATKTGTVRDGASRPLVGWIVGVLDDVVIVQATSGKAPRQVTDRFVVLVEQSRRLVARDGVEVQLFSLLTPSQIDLRCDRGGFSVTDGKPAPLPGGWARLADVLSGRLVCLGAPFEARLPRVTEGRPYAGVFRREVPAPWIPPPGTIPTERERRARTGSEVLFRTTRLSYVTGVLASEDASIVGEPRAALARVISHNVDTRERHGSRPVCDTTHCQVFQGSPRAVSTDADALARPKLKPRGWLPFSRGGDEPWTATRPRKDVERALVVSLSLVQRLESSQGTLVLVRTVTDDGDPYEERQSMPCERLRGPLKLPACPTGASWTGATVEFHGLGKGHGLGLDVEAARKSGADQDAILERAFPGATR
jgi:hypothetical protein